MFKGFIGVLFQINCLAGPQRLIDGDQKFGFTLLNAVHQGFGRKSAEHDAVRQAQPGAGQHRYRQLPHHGKIQRHAIAPFKAFFLEYVGKPADFAVQRQVGEDSAVFIRFSLPDDRRPVAGWCVEVPIQTVVTDIGVTAPKPLVKNPAVTDIEIVFDDFLRFFVPEEFCSDFGPEPLRVLDRALVDFLILIETLDPCLF